MRRRGIWKTDRDRKKTATAKQFVLKNTLQDFKSNKFTYVTLLGIEETKKRIQSLTQAAKASLINLSKNTAFLSDLCDYLMTRDQ